MSKFLLNSILSFPNKKTRLNLIKYNKKLMSKLNVSLYSIQKEYFNSIITESLFNTKDILNKLFDKETLNNLISDYENDRKGIYENEKLFKKIADLETYEIIKKAKKSSNIRLSNLIELNLYSLEYIELPSIILTNLEKLSLFNISNLKFITNNSNISLSKLKYLELKDTIISEENENLKINADNLIYLDLRLIMNDDERKNYDDGDDEVMIFEYLNNLIKVFNFDFLSLFLIDETIIYSDLFVNSDLKNKFKNSVELFNQKKIVEKFDYFNFVISFGVENTTGSVLYGNKITYQYSFFKTINNKFCFKSFYDSGTYGDDSNFNFIKKEIRICNNRNYNNHYFIDKEIIIKEGAGFDGFDEDLNDISNINKFSIIENESLAFLTLLKEIKENNNLETILFEYLDIEYEPKFFEYLKKFKKLRIFVISKYCRLTNKQLITLLKCLSECKYLLKIDINFKQNLELNEKEKKMIYKLFPDITIEITKKNSYIYWINNKPTIKILKYY